MTDTIRHIPAPFSYQTIPSTTAIRARFDGREEPSGKRLQRVVGLGLYQALTELRNEAGRGPFTCLQSALAERCGMSRDCTVRYLQALVEAGVVLVERDGKSNVYTVLDEPQRVVSEDTSNAQRPINVSSRKTQRVVQEDTSLACKRGKKEETPLTGGSAREACAPTQEEMDLGGDHPAYTVLADLARKKRWAPPSRRSVSRAITTHPAVDAVYVARRLTSYLSNEEGRFRRKVDLQAHFSRWMEKQEGWDAARGVRSAAIDQHAERRRSDAQMAEYHRKIEAEKAQACREVEEEYQRLMATPEGRAQAEEMASRLRRLGLVAA
jgi:DNA-binding MarR family transcriptional regulator